jgi:clan AA aspartic protease (TIGR02281 family)
MRGFARSGIALLVLATAPVAAEVYRWTDEQGRLHFAQSLDQVPDRFREAALASASEAGAPESPVQTYRSSDAAPTRRSTGRDGALRIPFERHGTLMKVEARVNDRVDVPFYVDTGASGVALPRAMVERLGIPLGPATPSVVVATANGPVRVPVVQLDSVELGGARVEALEATVISSMEIGLLGGSFFNHFVYAVDAAEGVISLRQNEGLRGGLDAEAWRGRFRALRGSLAVVEGFLGEGAAPGPNRRQQLEARRVELVRSLEALELEAARVGVPESWRE